jgi:2-phospho-L-lactate/phosphoenolpyruvate guanylyltransferase
MRTTAILPIKSLGAAKQRLASMLGSGSRQALAQAMFSDVLASLRHVDGLHEIVVVTANDVAESAARGNGVRLLHDPDEAGQSAAAAIGIRHAMTTGCERVLLVPGDTPLLDPGEVGAMLDRSDRITIVPDRHGTGTNCLLLAPPDVIEPSFGPGSLARHVAAAEGTGGTHRVADAPGLALDVDTPADLTELAAELELRRGHAPSTRGAFRQLERAGASPVRVPQASA